jgi:hypothetical protein
MVYNDFFFFFLLPRRFSCLLYHAYAHHYLIGILDFPNSEIYQKKSYFHTLVHFL